MQMQAARQLEGLKLGKRVIARFDVGEARPPPKGVPSYALLVASVLL